MIACYRYHAFDNINYRNHVIDNGHDIASFRGAHIHAPECFTACVLAVFPAVLRMRPPRRWVLGASLPYQLRYFGYHKAAASGGEATGNKSATGLWGGLLIILAVWLVPYRTDNSTPNFLSESALLDLQYGSGEREDLRRPMPKYFFARIGI